MLYDIGIYNKGKYVAIVEGKETKEYALWRSILKRCSHQYKNHSIYDDCSICDEWLDFQNFAEWYNKNYYQINDDKMYINKDILNKGNKIYSPSTCVFVNRHINNLFTLRKNKRGDLPLGVKYRDWMNKYQVQFSRYGKMESFGSYATVEEAFNVYKKEKENYIKEVADMYKEQIPTVLYEALYNYKIDIKD